jgi:branched-chain amino acid transport system ATP-binding protein
MTGDAPPVLDVDALHVHYGSVHAVRGISLRVDPGEVVALLGPNGAGKTSTLRAISRLEPFRGDVRIAGESTRRTSPEALARSGVRHVPEGRRVFPTLTVHENLQVGAVACRGHGLPIDHVYELFPTLRDLRQRAGWALSGGEQQMVAIGRALVGGPRLLLLDEPSLGLAPIVVKAVAAALREISRTVPMLLVEQNTDLALRLCRRAYVLVQGRVVLEGTPDELTDRQRLLHSYLGQGSARAVG